MRRVPIIASQVLLVGFALGILAAQLAFLPMTAQQFADMAPELDYLHAPMLYSLELVLVLADVVIVCLWMLLSRISAGTIFSDSSFRLVNAIVASFAGAALILLGIFVALFFVVQEGGPGIFLALLAGIGGTAFAALVLLVMRGLLRTATQQHDYLAEVV